MEHYYEDEALDEALDELIAQTGRVEPKWQRAPCERTEDELNALIDKRAEGSAKANAEEMRLRARTRQRENRRQAKNRWLWIDYHGRLAQRFQAIADEHRTKRANLLREIDETLSTNSHE